MESQENGSSKDTKDDNVHHANCSTVNQDPNPTFNYAATGARPKIFPAKVMPIYQKGTSKKSHRFSNTFDKDSNRQASLDSSDEEYDKKVSAFPFDKLYQSNMKEGRNVFGNNNVWNSSNFGCKFENTGREEASTVEITVSDSKCDDEKNEVWDSGWDDAWRNGEQKDEESAEQKDVLDPRRAEETTGYVELAQEFSNNAANHAPVQYRTKCPYCRRTYDGDFLNTHLAHCIENPDVAEEKETMKAISIVSAVEDWRSAPNPTQGTWSDPFVVAFGDSSVHSLPALTSDCDIDESTGADADVTASDEGAVASASGFGTWSGFATEEDDVMIPCEFCGDLLPLSVIAQHQDTCVVGQ